MNIIATNIVRRRKELRMTQKDLAEQLGISDKTVSRWETGNQIPDALTIPEIAQVLNMSIDELYGSRENGKSDESSSAIKEEKGEYPNLQYGKILIFKVVLLAGVFLSFIAATITASIPLLYVSDWKVIMGLVSVGIILYFLVAEIAFHEFYKRKELTFYYERENVKWLGLALLLIDVILSVWFPILEAANIFKTMPYLGISITIGFNLILFLFGTLYRFHMKKQEFQMSFGNWLIPMILFLIGVAAAIRYILFVSQSIFSDIAGIGTDFLEYASYGAIVVGGYTESKMRRLAVTAGVFFALSQVVNYIFLNQIWKQKEWKRKNVLKGSAALIVAFVIYIIVSFQPYGKYTAYDLFEASLNENSPKKIEIVSATIGIDFANGNESSTYFLLQNDSSLAALVDQLLEIHIDEGTVEKETECRSVSIRFRGKVYEGEGWGENEANYYWEITIDEQGRAVYEGKEYIIKGNVDWDELYQLALSEYDGMNSDLYRQWLGQ